MATILIVDDRTTNRELLVTLLGYAGHHSLEAADGEAGLAIARAEQPDLIITDIVMPKMDGYEFARQVRADPAISQTQIIFHTSSYIVEETRRLAEACGVSLVLGKPIEPQHFLEQIQTALATTTVAEVQPKPEDFHQEHMRLLTDTLANKVDELEVEVAEHRQAEEKLGENEELFRTSFQYSPIGMCLTTLDGRFMDVNQALSNMLGYTSQEFREMHFNDITHPEDLEIGGDVLHKMLSGEIPNAEFEKRYLQKNGEPVWAQVNSTLLKDSAGKSLRFITHILNITERKRAEEALQQYAADLERRVEERTIELTHANRAKSEFLANMSHELRTPLNSILGLSEALLEQSRGPLNEKQAQALQVIEASGTHLLSLINDILEVSKIEADKLKIYLDIISVKDVCESSLNFVRELAIKKSITLDFWNYQEVSTLYADPQRLKQILINLLNNAVKFTPEKGNVSLEVELDHEHDQIQFFITDNGIGIAPDDLKKLFSPFMQVDSSLARQYQGTGLGLTIAYKLTELHGGSLQVESAVGKGSRFIVSLPWDQTHATSQATSPTEKPPQVAREPQQLLRPLAKILLADDHEVNTMMLGEYLQSRGYEVTTARNGLEALAKAEDTLPHLIIMDIQMPEMDGLEAIQHLRADSRFISTPIIALTALAMSGDRERCLEAGADEYMSKPVSLRMLAEKIQEILSQKNQHTT